MTVACMSAPPTKLPLSERISMSSHLSSDFWRVPLPLTSMGRSKNASSPSFDKGTSTHCKFPATTGQVHRELLYLFKGQPGSGSWQRSRSEYIERSRRGRAFRPCLSTAADAVRRIQ